MLAYHLALPSIFFRCLGHEMCGSKICPIFHEIVALRPKAVLNGNNSELLNEVNDNTKLIEWLITGDETWMYRCDGETKTLSS